MHPVGWWVAWMTASRQQRPGGPRGHTEAAPADGREAGRGAMCRLAGIGPRAFARGGQF